MCRRCNDTRARARASLFPGNLGTHIPVAPLDSMRHASTFNFPVKVAFFSASVMTRKASGLSSVRRKREPTLDAAFDD